jgi:putative transposase
MDLSQPDIAAGLWDSIVHRAETGQWWPTLFLVMPDHIHILVRFPVEPGMRKTMTAWKRYTAHTQGIPWQRDFFDHRLRNDESLVEKAHYIRNNPVRAGLAKDARDWPYVWDAESAQRGPLGERALPPLSAAHGMNVPGRDASPWRPHNTQRGPLGERALPPLSDIRTLTNTE